jgi:hypothetical protein
MDTSGSFPGGEAAGRETDHSPPSSAEVKECVELYLHSHNTSSWRGALVKNRDNFIFTFTFICFIDRLLSILHTERIYAFLLVLTADMGFVPVH